MRILCTLPNASELINGVKFAIHEAGRLSEEVAEEIGHAFLAIPGYLLHETPVSAVAQVVKAADPALAAVVDGAVAVAGDVKEVAKDAEAEVAAVDAAAGQAPSAADAETAGDEQAPAAAAKRGKKA
jgi:hypothetical protein